jgi:hypothetical protein
MVTGPNPKEPIPASVAAVMSMMLPGLGQLLKNQIMPGLLWAVFVASGYFAYMYPGLILHTLCILDAAFSRPNENWLAQSVKGRIAMGLGATALIAYIVLRNF